LEEVVTKVVVENLPLLVSPLGEREKIDRLLVAADLVIAQKSCGPGRNNGRTRARRSRRVGCVERARRD
jgi:hypothetical protein